jgi:antitoxin VapB
MLFAPIAHIEAIDRAELNRLLVAWGHRMGPVQRPKYTIEANHALFQNGAPVAVTAAGETVREVVGQTGIRREECVELVRLCAARRDLCRPMLRLWREMIFPALSAYHHRRIAVRTKALHSGDLYRFDGWVMLGKGGGGGHDRRTGRPGRRTKIWGWPPAECPTAKDAA